MEGGVPWKLDAGRTMRAAFKIKALLLPAWPDLVLEMTDHEPAEEHSNIQRAGTASAGQYGLSASAR